MEIPDKLLVFPLRLEEAGLAYMVTGGLAAALYGEARYTRDVDAVVRIAPDQVFRLTEVFTAPEFYCPPAEVMRIESDRCVGGHFNIIQSTTALKLDVYPLGHAPFERDAFQRRLRLQYFGHEIAVAPADYVIARKMEYYREGGSEKHIRDIEAMLRQSGQQLDREHLEESLRALGLTSLWKEYFEAEPEENW